MKTLRSLAKRVKITGTGKVLRHETQTGQDEHKGKGQESENGQEQGNEQENDGE